MASENKTKLTEELLALQDQRGRLVPRIVWQWAKRNKKSELFKQFEWQETKAAEAHWDDVARELIRTYLTITVVTDRKMITSVAYVRDPKASANEQSYVSLTNADLDERDAERIMLTELGRCESAIQRARSVANTLDQRHPGISVKLEDFLLGLVELAGTLKAAA